MEFKDYGMSGINVLPKSQWISGEKVKVKKNDEKDKKKTNLVSLITSCITSSFPELEECPEGKFIRFQEKLKNIIQAELG